MLDKIGRQDDFGTKVDWSEKNKVASSVDAIAISEI